MRRQTDRNRSAVLTAKDGQGLPEGDQGVKRGKERIAPELLGTAEQQTATS